MAMNYASSKPAVVLSRDASEDRRIFHLRFRQIDPLEGERPGISGSEPKNLKLMKSVRASEPDRLEKPICGWKTKEFGI
jgi:hypothetical protein